MVQLAVIHKNLPAIAYEQGGIMQQSSRNKQEAAGDAQAGAMFRILPLFQRNAPQRGEDDDAGHVQRPAGEVVFAHLRLAHRVEEELEIPDHACKCGKKVITNAA